jgi:hypothetical protein
MNFFIKEKNSRKIFISLFIAVIILLIANLTLEIIWSSKIPGSDRKRQIEPIGLDKIFKGSLSDLGIENNWIKLQKKRKISSGVYYSVAIPSDLPITVVLNEIFISFKNYNVDIKSEEQKINGRTLLTISSEDDLKLSCEFYYDKSISRDAGEIGIFITGITKLTAEEVDALLSIPDTFELLIVPSKASVALLKSLHEYKKGFGILFNDEITDLEFKLNSKYSKGRLKSSIRDILGKFPDASIFIIDDQSNLFTSEVYPLLKEEFKKRNLNLITEDSLSNLAANGSDSALKDFRIKIRETKRGEKAVFVITTEEFSLLQPEIIKFRKVGYKFVQPSGLIKE